MGRLLAIPGLGKETERGQEVKAKGPEGPDQSSTPSQEQLRAVSDPRRVFSQEESDTTDPKCRFLGRTC